MEFKPKIVEKIETTKNIVYRYYKAHIQCIKCKRIMDIKINKSARELYTEEVLKSYVCYVCSSKIKEGG